MSELDVIYDGARELLECVRSRVATTVNGVPQKMRVHVDFGTVADDDCCDGQLTVSLVNIFPSRSFPIVDTTPMNCGAPYTAATYGVRLVRCALTPDSKGNAPSPTALQAQARGMMQDSIAMWDGALCCMVGWANLVVEARESVITSFTPVGPEGACIGGELTLIVGYTNMCVCP